MLSVLVLTGCSSTATPSISTEDVVPIATEQTPMLASTWYIIQDIKIHATADSCRSMVRNQVYDFTTRAPQHPGWADKIIDICEICATPVFEKDHGGKEKLEMKLPDFYIGDLK